MSRSSAPVAILEDQQHNTTILNNKSFIEGRYGRELREEMMKKPILPPSPPIVVTKKPKPWCVDCRGECRMMSRRWKHRNGVSSSDDDDLYDYEGNQVVWPQPDGSYVVTGRRTQPGFS